MRGAEYGAEIAKSLNAELLLFHVVKPYNLPESLKNFAKAEHMATIDADLLKRGAQILLAGALDAARRAGVKDVQIEVEEGPIARTIAARAKSFKADCGPRALISAPMLSCRYIATRAPIPNHLCRI